MNKNQIYASEIRFSSEKHKNNFNEMVSRVKFDTLDSGMLVGFYVVSMDTVYPHFPDSISVDTNPLSYFSKVEDWETEEPVLLDNNELDKIARFFLEIGLSFWSENSSFELSKLSKLNEEGFRYFEEIWKLSRLELVVEEPEPKSIDEEYGPVFEEKLEEISNKDVTEEERAYLIRDFMTELENVSQITNIDYKEFKEVQPHLYSIYERAAKSGVSIR